MPDDVGFPSRPAESVGLARVPVTERLGFLRVTLEPGGPDVDTFLAPAGLVVVGLAFVGASYLFTRFFGSGTLHVVTVEAGGVNVSVDGTPTLENSPSTSCRCAPTSALSAST